MLETNKTLIMIKLCIPFLLSDNKQLPEKLIKQRKLWLEANVFDSEQLVKLIKKQKFSKLLKDASRVGIIRAFHFPVENSDYLESKIISKLLYKSIKIIGENKIPYFVLHSNHIRLMEKFDHKKLPKIRQKYLNYYKTLGKFAQRHNVTVCIENIPIIGNEGNDFDSVFVFPADFNNLPKTGIKIVWDMGHWAYTCNTYKTLSKKIKSLPKKSPTFFDFLKLKKNLSHFHFSSFKKLTPLMCTEGVIPQDGDFNKNILAKYCRIIHEWPQEIGMTLEIQEKNYHNRVNLAKTLKWFDSSVFNSQIDKAKKV